MDWTAAIEKNREALKRIVAMLIAMAEVGLGGQFPFSPRNGGDASRLALAEKSKQSPAIALPRHLRLVILRLLRPAEAAVRRLIIVAARGLTSPPPRLGKPVIPAKTHRTGRPPQNLDRRLPSLPLLDRLSPSRVRARPAAAGVPRISVPGFSTPFPVTVRHSDDPVDATRLALRLQALAAALDDLPGQAKRFARWRAQTKALALPQNSPLPRREAIACAPSTTRSVVEGAPLPAIYDCQPPCGEGAGVGVPRHRTSRPASFAPARPHRLWPLKPGRPPGWLRKPVHEVHEVLDVVHGLAHWVLTSPDTS